MATKLEKLKWSLYLKKRQLLFKVGIKKGLIHPYEEELIENLRHVYYGGLPGSILLLSPFLCRGYCYDRALFITLGFGDDDFQLVDADIDSLKLNPKYIDENKIKKDPRYADHCFVERTKSDGTTWVYDTTLGIVFEKKLYYKLENPKIRKINDKETTLNYIEYQDIKEADIQKDKYILPIIMPIIEKHLKSDNNFYKVVLEYEIELFKKEIDYAKVMEDFYARREENKDKDIFKYIKNQKK